MSKSIDYDAAQAFVDRRTRTLSRNTWTTGETLYLFGNRIAWWDENDAPWISFCGWNSVTTRNRLNAVCGKLEHHGFGRHDFYCRNGALFHNGDKINPSDKIALVGPLTALAPKACANLANQQEARA